MKPTLLILHGALGSAAQMQAFAALLDIPSWVPDLPGHGEGIPPEEFSIRAFAQHLLDEMDNQGIEKMDVFGYSMGGYVALVMAHIAPEKLSKIMTFSTKFHWTSETAAKELRHLNVDKIIEKVPQFAMMLEKRHQKQGWQKVVANTAYLMENLGIDPILTDEVLQTIPNPVLLCTGDQDQTATPEETLHAYRMLPNAGLWISARTPHPFEKLPLDEMAKKLVDFLYS